MNDECEGICKVINLCKGEIKEVEIFDGHGMSWGIFNYCETAIEKNIENGFLVKLK